MTSPLDAPELRAEHDRTFLSQLKAVADQAWLAACAAGDTRSRLHFHQVEADQLRRDYGASRTRVLTAIAKAVTRVNTAPKPATAHRVKGTVMEPDSPLNAPQVRGLYRDPNRASLELTAAADRAALAWRNRPDWDSRTLRDFEQEAADRLIEQNAQSKIRNDAGRARLLGRGQQAPAVPDGYLNDPAAYAQHLEAGGLHWAASDVRREEAQRKHSTLKRQVDKAVTSREVVEKAASEAGAVQYPPRSPRR